MSVELTLLFPFSSSIALITSSSYCNLGGTSSFCNLGGNKKDHTECDDELMSRPCPTHNDLRTNHHVQCGGP